MTELPVISITGDRLALGPMRRDFAPLLLRWQNDFSAQINVYMPQPITSEDYLAFYDRWVSNPRAVRFLAYERETWRPIGRCSLNEIDYRNRSAEFGVLVGDPVDRGKGYGTEMARLMLDHAFFALGLHTIMLTVVEFNAGGMRAYQRAGFREIGRFRQSFYALGRHWDDIYMECLATDFVRQTWPRR